MSTPPQYTLSKRIHVISAEGVFSGYSMLRGFAASPVGENSSGTCDPMEPSAGEHTYTITAADTSTGWL